MAPQLLGFQRHNLSVDLDENEHRGHTKETAGGTPVHVATKVDVRRMRHLLARVLGKEWYESESLKGNA